MKRILLVTGVLLAALAIVSCSNRNNRRDNNGPMRMEQLPATAQTFVKSHFGGVTVSDIKDERGKGGSEYVVNFSNGWTAEFDRRGEWRMVDCKNNAVPEGVIPVQIKDYVMKNYPQQRVTMIDRTKGDSKSDYDVKLDNGVKLRFNKNFDLLSDNGNSVRDNRTNEGNVNNNTVNPNINTRTNKN